MHQFNKVDIGAKGQQLPQIDEMIRLFAKILLAINPMGLFIHIVLDSIYI